MNKEKQMNNYEKHAREEFRAAGWTDANGQFKDEMQKMICEHVLKLLNEFHGEGHSGSTAPYTINLFTRLAKFEPLGPLTGEDWEWSDVSEYSGKTLYQNKRCGSVFKHGDGTAYNIDGRVFWEWVKDENGKPFKSYYTGNGSQVPVTFPYAVPEKPEYVYRYSDAEPRQPAQNEQGFL